MVTHSCEAYCTYQLLQVSNWQNHLSVTKVKIFGASMTSFFSHTSSPNPLANPHSSVSNITRIQLPLITPSSLAQATSITHLDYCSSLLTDLTSSFLPYPIPLPPPVFFHTQSRWFHSNIFTPMLNGCNGSSFHSSKTPSLTETYKALYGLILCPLWSCLIS